MEKNIKIRRCEHCGNEYQYRSGFQNFKNLWRKPSWNEWFILAMIIAMMIMAYFYYNEMEASYYLRTHFTEVCQDYLQKGIIKMNVSDSGSSNNNILNNLSGSLAGIENKINSMDIIPNASR